MLAIRIAAHGDIDVLERVDVPTPDANADEVNVRVTHVGLNHLDLWVRRGVPGHKFPLPLIPGSDVVGIREDTGQRVALYPAKSCGICARCLAGHEDLCRKYRIRGENFDGGCCQRVCVSPSALLPLPEFLASERAAALPLALLTAWHMLVGRARITPGMRILVQGGAGGVGSLAIQVAKLQGCEVIATASTPEKRALCESLGAHRAVNYPEAVAAIKDWTRGEGVDVVVEHGGADTWRDSVRSLRWGGSLVTCGATSGNEVSIDLRVLFFKQLSLLGSTMGNFSEMRQAWAAVAAGNVVPVVDRVMPMTEIGAAHHALEGRGVLGKIVLEQDLRL